MCISFNTRAMYFVVCNVCLAFSNLYGILVKKPPVTFISENHSHASNVITEHRGAGVVCVTDSSIDPSCEFVCVCVCACERERGSHRGDAAEQRRIMKPQLQTHRPHRTPPCHHLPQRGWDSDTQEHKGEPCSFSEKHPVVGYRSAC